MKTRRALITSTIMLNPQITVQAKALYVVLKLHADRSGKCFPSRQTLADALGLSKPTISRHLAELESLGIVSRGLVSGKGTVYTLQEPEDLEDQPANGEDEEAAGVITDEKAPFSKIITGVITDEKGNSNNTINNSSEQSTTTTGMVDAVDWGSSGIRIEPAFPDPTEQAIHAHCAMTGLNPVMAMQAFRALLGKGWDGRSDWRPFVTAGARLRMRKRDAGPSELGAEFFDASELSRLKDSDQRIEQRLEHWSTPEGIRYRYPSDRATPTGWQALYKPKSTEPVSVPTP